ncbi:MAG TPA: ribbon-helix-helix protein, CopG family [Candidatus Acidoferrales bacterium]|nr:ribbon-helix-helix protein, CopG family [Candidatus Acidoferrales bacterium]
MATATKKTREQMIEQLAKSQADEIAHAEIVKGHRSESPVSVRLSAPLLEALDRLAQKEHRKRGNLIQHILWQYIQEHQRKR